ncbi:MAG: hypothetical protein HQL19_04465 [Candidatus Omnitrophica bacterium]|nr:hypothetical protein [Candidatus Omnitrophota bacterium]
MKKAVVVIGVVAMMVCGVFYLNRASFASDESAPVAMKTIYTCPMHPEVVSDVPGKCPKCGMDLEAKQVPDYGVQVNTEAAPVVNGTAGVGQ